MNGDHLLRLCEILGQPLAARILQPLMSPQAQSVAILAGGRSLVDTPANAVRHLLGSGLVQRLADPLHVAVRHHGLVLVEYRGAEAVVSYAQESITREAFAALLPALAEVPGAVRLRTPHGDGEWSEARYPDRLRALVEGHFSRDTDTEVIEEEQTPAAATGVLRHAVAAFREGAASFGSLLAALSGTDALARGFVVASRDDGEAVFSYLGPALASGCGVAPADAVGMPLSAMPRTALGPAAQRRLRQKLAGQPHVVRATLVRGVKAITFEGGYFPVAMGASNTQREMVCLVQGREVQAHAA
ncbi:MAG: hypothetical protein EAZ99_19445 [Alphaproteobacteria bacterium]|nr:MAG: hypothetical protein EAZ99_19445 [Alphaproteobacteria bacterium]